MQRYFSNELNNNIFSLSENDSYHIIKVMRMKLSDEVEVVYNEKVYICKIIALNPVKVEIIKELNEYNEMNKKVIIVQSLVNENKMDLILQKATELGCYQFIPYKAKNSVIKENDKSYKKIIRWQSIVKEAAEQSKRNIIPKVENIIGINELIKYDASLKILLSVNECQVSIKNLLQNNKNCDTIIIVVGPEGGFTKEEEQILTQNNFIRCSIGKRVLRTETASLAALSMINYEWMV